ncbi:Glyoxylase, beta-lactamase superfamily II [Lishizhenia tianjinensis]|uniref:Glyoxylase, beta-lactamase superfamily II n=1 Tax=Lishizhenia tianjinensis TaxID=477690 RepID=A0A1I7A105_9FLAO|nr:MBL fold metallo-hydrolase [Lishizhenia tianjinensis]SFT68599.1 Glyoxylase, beta-lactamase superfamily II [Lishizhenia tianjinensis]
MKVQKFTFNPFQENTFVVYDNNNKGVVIDPGMYFKEEEELFKNFIAEEGIELLAILNTHAHLDHVAGNSFVKNTYNIPLYLHPKDLPTLQMSERSAAVYGLDAFTPSPLPDMEIEENTTLSFGELDFEVLFTPGHAPGHVVFYNAANKIVFNGDVLFQGSFGRTDLPGGDMATLKKSITEVMFNLPGDTIVCTGHGGETKIEIEKQNNPILNY